MLRLIQASCHRTGLPKTFEKVSFPSRGKTKATKITRPEVYSLPLNLKPINDKGINYSIIIEENFKAVQWSRFTYLT